jgi:glucosamine 6-phosphate synthetase-like amidotransferase/phosphosugar isomerase protein
MTMTSYRTSYERISRGMERSTDASIDAKTGDDAAWFVDRTRKLKAELDALTAARLKTSADQYAAITADMRDSKKELEDVVKDIENMVKTAEIASKVAAAFTKIIALL